MTDTERKIKDKEYKIGDTVYYIPFNTNIIVKCTIKDVDYQFRNRDSSAYLFYDIDEPVGHDVDLEELYDTLEECQSQFEEYECCEDEEEWKPRYSDLHEWRKASINFIVSTWNLSPEEEEMEKNRLINYYMCKSYEKDWWIVK